MTVLLITLCVALALFAALALFLLAVMGNPSSAEARLVEITTGPPSEVHYSLRDVLSYITRPLAPFRRMFGFHGDEDLGYRLSVAGYREPQDIDTFLDAKLLCPVVGVLLATFTGSSNLIPASLALGAAGFFAPDVFLIWSVNKRKKAISRSLPDAMDLLVICMEAGLGMDQAILRVAQEFATVSPELSDELMILCREQRAGKPRVDAWRSMADRVDVDAIHHFASMLTQSERLGTPIARALAQFADSLRTKRLMQAEEQAAKTTVKLLFPLVMFIFPAMFVVILGPAGLLIVKGFEDMSR
jgi:tight adherence protein C